MSETKIPGLKAGHQIITPVCRTNRGITPAFLEAAERLQRLYDNYARSSGSDEVNWHLVLVREDKEAPSEWVRPMTTLDEKGLAPCPFCGGEASGDSSVRYTDRYAKEQGWSQSEFYYCNCILCGSNNKGIIGHRTRDEAIAAWNRRAPAQSINAEMLEVLKPFAALADEIERCASLCSGPEADPQNWAKACRWDDLIAARAIIARAEAATDAGGDA